MPNEIEFMEINERRQRKSARHDIADDQQMKLVECCSLIRR